MKRQRDGSFSAPKLVEIADWMTVPRLLRARAEKTPRAVAVKRQSELGNQWIPVTAAAFVQEINTVARGMIGLGLEMGDSLAILAPTSYAWSVLDLAAQTAGIVVVPIYESNSATQIRFILEDAEVRCVVTDTAAQAELVKSVRTPGVGEILCLDSGAMGHLEHLALEIDPERLEARFRAVHGSDLATIIYTSGTTGAPKGVELTHTNLAGTVAEALKLMPQVIDSKSTRVLLFLPMAHILARIVGLLTICGRGVLAHTPDTKNLLTDIGTFRPTALLVVPRVLEKIYNSADAKAGRGLKLRIFRWAAKVAIKYSRSLDSRLGAGPLLRMQRLLAHRLVYRKLLALLGGRAQYVVSGAAPLGARLGHFYRGIGITVLEGYGLSETTGPSAINLPTALKIGGVGLPFPGNSIKIASDGEVLVKGLTVFRCYHNNPEATAEAFQDGWFFTGDIGRMDRTGHLQITGRKKELIVTASGKNVAPAAAEDRLRAHPLISQVVVVGDQKPFIAALLTLDAEMLPVWLRNKGLPLMSVAEAAENEQVLTALSRAVERTNKAVSRAESIRKFKVLTTDFTEANGLLTPSLKMKRAAVLRRFQAEVEELYAAPKQ